MAPRNTTTPAKTAPVKSRFAALCEEATANYEPKEPYSFDGTNPPTPINEPVSAEQITAFAQLLDSNGEYDAATTRELFKAVCGPAFDAVWRVVGPKHYSVLLAVIDDIAEHFSTVPTKDGADLPGGV